MPEYDPRALWEKLVLDGFQAGLAWITILRKRETMRAAFDGFDPEKVARYGEDDRARLLADPGIIRSRAKIDAAIGGARIWLEMRDGGEGDAGGSKPAGRRNGKAAKLKHVARSLLASYGATSRSAIIRVPLSIALVVGLQTLDKIVNVRYQTALGSLLGRLDVPLLGWVVVLGLLTAAWGGACPPRGRGHRPRGKTT